MKNLILIFFLFLFTAVNAQIDYYPINAGQYAIYNVGAGDTITVDRKFTYPATVAYRNRIDVVDTIFKIPATASLDTISNFVRPAGKIRAIGLERKGEWSGSLIADGDSTIYFAYDTGADAIIYGYINPFEYSVTVRDLTITNTMTALFIQEETFYMITEEGEIMVEEF